MKRRIKLILFLLIIIIAAAAVYFSSDNDGNTVLIKSNGEIIDEIQLDKVDKPYYLDVNYNGFNKLYIDSERVSVVAADCPDKLCIQQSERGGYPIVCLPHRLVIELQ